MHKNTNYRALEKGQTARENIYEYIYKCIQEPGRIVGPDFAEIGTAVGLHRTTVAYHVKQLVKNRKISHIIAESHHFYSLPQTLPPLEKTAPPSAQKIPPAPAEAPQYPESAQAEKLSARFLMAATDSDHKAMQDYLDNQLEKMPVPKRKTALELAFSLSILQKDKEGTALLRRNARKAGMEESALAAIAENFDRKAFYAAIPK